MKIFLDAMGGDNAPDEIVRGAVLAVEEYHVPLYLVGDEKILKNSLQKQNLSSENLTVIHASESIGMQEEPALAVRKKKDSSLVVMARLLKESKDGVMVSAGSTGAVLASALFCTGRIKGIQRPAIAAVIPAKKPTILIDSGANADCKAEYLLQFAQMGSAYMQGVFGVEKPRIGLVNIGTEECKGNTLYKQAHSLLQKSSLNFVGNIEGKEFLNGVCDVLVCDGFTGNVILKTIEGTLRYVLGEVKGVIMTNMKTKFGGALIKKDLYGLKTKFDPSSLGGAPLLGIKGGVIKAHGSSDAIAIKNAIHQAITFGENHVMDKIINSL